MGIRDLKTSYEESGNKRFKNYQLSEKANMLFASNHEERIFYIYRYSYEVVNNEWYKG